VNTGVQSEPSTLDRSMAVRSLACATVVPGHGGPLLVDTAAHLALDFGSLVGATAIAITAAAAFLARFGR
jgi:hypothetical protein